MRPSWSGGATGGKRHRDGHAGEHQLGRHQDRHPDQDGLRQVLRGGVAGEPWLVDTASLTSDWFSGQVIVGESFSCSLDHELPSLLYMYR